MASLPANCTATEPDADTVAFYRAVMQALERAGVPVLVGGAFAFARYTGIERNTKDLDLFLRRSDYDRATAVLSRAGYETRLPFPHWLGKAYAGSLFVDLIFNSGNGLTPVDDSWFERALDAEVLGLRARIMPIEEMVCSKAFIMERERFDGADVAHLLRAQGPALDWRRLLQRFGPNWRVLLCHLSLFGFIYPAERAKVPAWVVDQLIDRLREETHARPPAGTLCRGTLLSREQYLVDVHQEGYTDARLAPAGTMSAEEIATWTAAIDEERRAAEGGSADRQG